MTPAPGPTLLERIRAIPPRPPVAHKQGHRRPRVESAAAQTDRTAEIEKKNSEVTELRTKQIREILADGLEHTIGEIAERIGFGIAPTGQLVRHLVNVRQLVCQMRDGNKNWYRLATPDDVFTTPQAKSIAVPTFDPHAFRQRLEQLLASGASYDLRELVRNMRNTWPQADDANVQVTLEQLRDEGKVELIPLGSTLRYRRTAEAVSA